MKTNTLFLFLTFFFSSLPLFSQIQAVTSDGRAVTLNDDGTWFFPVSQNKGTQPNVPRCEDLISTETDKVTGKTTTGSKKNLVIVNETNDKGLGIHALDLNGTIALSVIIVGAGSCVDEKCRINVLFRDGSRVEYFHYGKFNCDKTLTVYFGGNVGKKNDLSYFKTKEVETMRVWTTAGYVELDFSKEQSVQLIKTLQCLTEK